jgi:hypothetical protein
VGDNLEHHFDLRLMVEEGKRSIKEQRIREKIAV